MNKILKSNFNEKYKGTGKNKLIGRLGENIATKYLENFKYKIISRNFSCRHGEIDIIASNESYIIFVEVKTRTNLQYGEPAEAVTEIKQKHIKNSAKYFLYKNNINHNYIRFDIIEVYINTNKHKCKVNHIKQVL